VFVGFLVLIWTRECVGESLAPEVLYLFLRAFILSRLARNAMFCPFMFTAPFCGLVVLMKYSWSERPVCVSLSY
jgi:hypothetical protein